MLRHRYFVVGLLSLILGIRFLWSIAYDPPVLAQGDVLTITGAGDFATGITMGPVGPVSVLELSATWDYSDSADYLSFEDSTTTPGFTIKIYMSSADLFQSGTTTGNFVYSGGATGQDPIDVNNFKVWSNYSATDGGLPPTKGINDDTKVLNINAGESCGAAQTLGNYDFNNSLTDSSTSPDFGMVMSPIAQEYLVSSVVCKTVGTIDIRRTRLTIPPGYNLGNYTSTMIIAIIDGYSS